MTIGLDALNNDVLKEIIYKLDYKTIIAAGCVNKRFAALIKEDSFWNGLLRKMGILHMPSLSPRVQIRDYTLGSVDELSSTFLAFVRGLKTDKFESFVCVNKENKTLVSVSIEPSKTPFELSVHRYFYTGEIKDPVFHEQTLARLGDVKIICNWNIPSEQHQAFQQEVLLKEGNFLFNRILSFSF